MSEDFYDVLGVGRDASEEDIKRAYREKARQYHPDVSDDPDAEEKFKKVQRAKEVLSDEEARQAYDRLGHDRFEQARKQGGFGGGGGGGAGGRAGDPFGGMGGAGGFGDLNDIFEQFFGGGTGGGGRARQRPRGGADLRTSLSIDLEDAYEGVTKQVTLRRPEHCPECDGRGHPPDADPTTCPECNGQGQVTQVQQTAFGRVQQTTACRRCEGEGQLYDETCDACGGEGVVRRERSLSVDVPAGIRDGQTLRMDGEGGPGEPGAPNGDLLIEIAVRDHERFDREGDDVYVVQPVSFPQVVFGDTVEVETLGGSVEMDVPAGTQSGETFRLSGKGMPRLRRRGHGDQYVRVQVVTPESLTEEQREAIEQLAEASGEELSVEDGFFEKIRKSL